MAGGEAILSTALQAFGRADILINNAGILRDKGLAGMTEEMWDSVMKVHLKGTFCATQPVFKWMKENGGGVIVNTTSASGLAGNFGQTNYGAAKGGVRGFSNTLAIEGKKYGIRVWTIAPAAATQLTAGLLPPEIAAAWTPERVAPIALYMVSSLSGDKTNRTVFACGTKMMEVKMVQGPALRNSGNLTAQDIAAAEKDWLLDSQGLDFNP